jgi:acyl-coenzyme A synthetase/AMP-(fatty) acid ligase
MKHCHEIADCTVVGTPLHHNDFSAPVAVVRFKQGITHSALDLLGQLNRVLKEFGKPSLASVVISTDFPLGPTGKVLKRELREHFKHIYSKTDPKYGQKMKGGQAL